MPRCKLFALALFSLLLSAPLLAQSPLALVRTAGGSLALAPIRAGAGLVAPGHERVFPYDGVCHRSLIRLREQARAARGLSTAPAASAEVDTLRVVLIRVSFQTDRDNALSTLATGGGFDLTPNGAQVVDPTPHDKGYFNSHMEALANYYRFQSCGRLEIVWTVLPAEEDSSYKISDLADYGPGKGGTWKQENLIRFFHECVSSADRALAAEGYPVRFGDFDAIVVAHAGANLQSDINGDTPNDVPSFFATLGPEDEFAVDGGATIVKDGSVIPETATQDGLNGGIAAVLAHDFGHQLGLPDLYNVARGTPTVGFWDLMDAGTLLSAQLPDREGRLQYVEGFLPGGLSAWSRTFLGWTEVDTVAVFEDELSLAAVERCPARVVRVEAATDEYFLIENRAALPDGLPIMFVVDDHGVIIGTADDVPARSAGASPDLVNGYDVLLPQEFGPPRADGGPGLLIWRVDERLLGERLADNLVNSSTPFAVTLLEADGVVDLGDPSAGFPFGSFEDAYYAGNSSALSDSTLPPAWSTLNVPTGVRVEGISARSGLMSFGAGVRDVRMTKKLPDAIGPFKDGVLMVPEDHRALVVGANGNGWTAGSENPVFSIGRPVVLPPAFVANPTPGKSGFVVVGEQTGGYIHLFNYGEWSEHAGWPSFIARSLATHPVPFLRGGRLFIAAADKSHGIHVIDSAGTEVRGSPITLPDPVLSNIVLVRDGNGEGTGMFLVAGTPDPGLRAWLFRMDIFPAGSSDSIGFTEGYPKRLLLSAADIEGGVALVGGDIVPEENGDEAFILCRATGRIILCGARGVLSERTSESRIVSAPALVDLNGDSQLDLVYSNGEGIYAISPSGANLTGWPRKVGMIFELSRASSFAAPVTVLGTGRGAVVVAGSDAGVLYLLDSQGRLIGGSPRKVSRSIDNAVEAWQGAYDGTLSYGDGKRLTWRAALAEPGVETLWATIWGDLSRSAWGGRSEGGRVAGGAWLGLEKDLIVYPNPSNGERVGFHFLAPSGGEARLQIVTLTGDLVSESRKGLSGGEDEFVVSMAGKASGIYLARLVISAEGRRVEAFRKFAIVR